MNQEILNQNDYFISQDLALCACLVCYGDYQIEAIDRQGSRATFFIRRDEKLDDLVQRYWTHQLQVEPMGYFSCLKEIKSRIYTKE